MKLWIGGYAHLAQNCPNYSNLLARGLQGPGIRDPTMILGQWLGMDEKEQNWLMTIVVLSGVTTVFAVIWSELMFYSVNRRKQHRKSTC